MTEHTPEKVSDLIAEARAGDFEDRGWMIDVIDRMADALEAVGAERDEARIWAETMQAQKFEWEGKEAAVRAERDEALARVENGPCWDEGPALPNDERQRPGPLCELRAGHIGAHQGGAATWMRNPSSYNQVARERDEALAVIADIRREVEDFTQSDNDALCAIEHRLSRIPEHPKED